MLSFKINSFLRQELCFFWINILGIISVFKQATWPRFTPLWNYQAIRKRDWEVVYTYGIGALYWSPPPSALALEPNAVADTESEKCFFFVIKLLLYIYIFFSHFLTVMPLRRKNTARVKVDVYKEKWCLINWHSLSADAGETDILLYTLHNSYYKPFPVW